MRERIIITGGAGFLGKHLVKKLEEKNNVFVPRIEDYDLREEEHVEKLFSNFSADILIHLATVSGGMSYYKDHPGKVFYENLKMGMNIIENARKNNLRKIIMIGSALGYPKNAKVPYKEEDFWNGYPNDIEDAYGISNKVFQVMGKLYKKEYGLDITYIILTNLYGPEDHFDKDAHLIPILIKKIYDAKINGQKEISLWGSGNAIRDFLYVEDAADAIISTIKLYDSTEPLNIGSGKEISLKNLADKISEKIGYNGKILWDTTKPEGSLRRSLDITKAINTFGYKPKIDLDEGIEKTIKWYEKNLL